MPVAPRAARSGFSLIELVVVVAIIAVLTAMLFPAIGLVRASAESTACAGNMRQLAMGAIAYAAEAHGIMPMSGAGWGYTSWTSPSNGRWWHDLDPYTETYRIYNCPTAARLCPDFVVFDKPTMTRWGMVPRSKATSGWICLTAYNTVNWGRYPDAAYAAPRGPMTIGKTASYLASFDPAYNPDDCPLFTDGVGYFDASKTGMYAYLLNNSWGCYFPHRKRQNTAFIDGRVRQSSYADYTITGTASNVGAVMVR